MKKIKRQPAAIANPAAPLVEGRLHLVRGGVYVPAPAFNDKDPAWAEVTSPVGLDTPRLLDTGDLRGITMPGGSNT